MESIISKLYYGEISPCSQPAPTTERYLRDKEEVERLNSEILAKYPDLKNFSKANAGSIKGISKKAHTDVRIQS